MLGARGVCALESSSFIINQCIEAITVDGCTHGDVQLVGTPLRHEGVVEICLNSHWGRVCRDGWDNNDAKVVCKQLGYGSEGKISTLK